MKANRFISIVIISLLLISGCEKEEKTKNHAPVADLSADVTSGNRPLKVEFNANMSTDEDGDILTYYWEGYVTFEEGTCRAIELTINKKSAGEDQIAPVRP